MANQVQVALRLKNFEQLHGGLRRLSVATGKLPAQVINRAVMSIALRARNRMPVTPPETIRSGFGEYKVPVYRYSKKGELLKVTKSKSFFAGGSSKNPDVALAVLTVQARVRNKKAGRWELAQSPFKGVPRAQGAERMLAKIRQVLSARLRSRGFFKACAGTVLKVFGKVSGRPQGPSGLTARIGKLANGRPAAGTGRAVASFWVSATTHDTNANKDALRKVAEPVWQEALNHERDFVLRKAAEVEYKNTMRGLGFRVT